MFREHRQLTTLAEVFRLYRLQTIIRPAMKYLLEGHRVDGLYRPARTSFLRWKASRAHKSCEGSPLDSLNAKIALS